MVAIVTKPSPSPGPSKSPNADLSASSLGLRGATDPRADLQRELAPGRIERGNAGGILISDPQPELDALRKTFESKRDQLIEKAADGKDYSSKPEAWEKFSQNLSKALDAFENDAATPSADRYQTMIERLEQFDKKADERMFDERYGLLETKEQISEAVSNVEQQRERSVGSNKHIERMLKDSIRLEEKLTSLNIPEKEQEPVMEAIKTVKIGVVYKSLLNDKEFSRLDPSAFKLRMSNKEELDDRELHPKNFRQSR